MKHLIPDPWNHIMSLEDAVTSIYKTDIVYIYPTKMIGSIYVSNEIMDEYPEFVSMGVCREFITEFDLTYMINSALEYHNKCDINDALYDNEEAFLNLLFDNPPKLDINPFKYYSHEKLNYINSCDIDCVMLNGQSMSFGKDYEIHNESLYKNKSINDRQG